jgi:hypothetical protein
VCRRKKGPPSSLIFYSRATFPCATPRFRPFPHEISTGPNPKIISLGSSPPQPPPLSTTAAQLLTYPLQPCIARTPQLRPFSPVSSSALGRAPPTNSRRRALAGASTHQIQQLLACTHSGGPSPPTDLVVAWEGR